MAERYYVLQWQSPAMPAPAFWYYNSKKRRDKAYFEMKGRYGYHVKRRWGYVDSRNQSLMSALESDRQRHPEEE